MQEESLWSLCSVNDIDTVLPNRYGPYRAFSLLYYDLYLRDFKESLKHTMLDQESVFQDQVSFFLVLSTIVVKNRFAMLFQKSLLMSVFLQYMFHLVSLIIFVSSDPRASSSVSKAEGSDDANGRSQQLIQSTSTFAP